MCKCKTCKQNQKTLKQNQRTLDEIKNMISKKMDVKIVGSESAKAVNLCKSTPPVENIVINYTYTDQGRQMMILDVGAPVSVAGVPWMKQYLKEFGLKIENMKSVECSQPFVSGPSQRYISESLIELLILITRMDGKEDVLTVQTYLVAA